ncbi:hypothetical protein TrLO_g15936 [Triparma laevis f. longispina]|uniref:Small nuclear ribonucleoprotein Sm D3 n=1 Tax=Triparma laevis f. longispina TaxID=1714387 RepID=A0A9W6ZPD9_9STRA|nr:hypothetical protein TrLO_g15936 [Triparma laevis f. longispina]
MATLGVPIRLLLEAEKHKVTVEMKSGETFRGLLSTAESSMNLQLSDCICTASNGKVRKMDAVYLKGSGIRLIVVPEMLRNAPCLGKQSAKRKRE